MVVLLMAMVLGVHSDMGYLCIVIRQTFLIQQKAEVIPIEESIRIQQRQKKEYEVVKTAVY